MKIKIPHLGYTLLVKEPQKEVEFTAYVIRDNKSQSTLYIQTPIKSKDMATLAHELVHVLQFIARDRNIDMVDEMEHMGYLMNYLFNEITGHEYE